MKESVFLADLPIGKAQLYTLSGGCGPVAEISDFGGVIRRLLVPARDGKMVNVALGYQDPARYFSPDPLQGIPCFGALIGRVGNRIGKGKFTLDGREYQVFCNERGNSLHGGKGFHNRLWEVTSYDGKEFRLRIKSPDGDCGYPGNLTVDAVYRVTADNALEMEMHAVTDAPTLVNLTNHNYFNLNGEETGSLEGHSLQIFASSRQEVDSELIPTGRWLPVEGTEYDFRKGRSMTEAFKLHNGGFDDNYLLDHPLDGIVRCAAVAASRKTGIRLEVEGVSPCVQLYTAGGLNGSIIGTSGKAYPRLSAFCLEMQHPVDAPNHPEYPSIRLDPGKTYSQVIRYRFSCVTD